ncbi:MAG: ca2+ sensor protein [Sphingomonas adhaesiva]|uniref:ca2+ sensor protein n=1 Tax=Sphingomonas adhaesiva TaxID=28212 RepID=UPI002FF48BE4
MKTPIILASLAATLLSGAAAAQTPPPSRDDADRVVTRQDAAAQADRRFAAMDTNRDGKISPDERRAFHEARRAEREAKRGAHRGGKDREWTQAQFRERALKRFDRIDTNHDGRIDPQEREAARMLMRARRVGHNGDRPMAPVPPAADANR